jgi:hypothetical protein
MLYNEQNLRPAIHAAFDQGGLGGGMRLVVTLLNGRKSHQQTVTAKLKVRVAELETRLNRNSPNSHNPPSSDGPKSSSVTYA